MEQLWSLWMGVFIDGKKEKRNSAFLVLKTKRNVMGTFLKMQKTSDGLQRDAGAGTMAFKVIQEPLCGF